MPAETTGTQRLGPSHQNESLEAQLQATLNVIPAYTWYAAPSGGLTFVNQRTADYLGLAKDHPLRFGIAVAAPWDSHLPFLHPDDREEARRVWSNCLRTGSAGEVSFRVRDSEGGYRWFLSRTEPLRAGDGTLLYWIGVNLDIQERKQAEFYLAEGQRLAQMGSWAFSAAGFDYWSPELFRIHGLDAGGKAPTIEEYWGLVHPEDRGSVEQEIQKMLATHCGFDLTKRIVRPDGRIRHVRCVGVPATRGETLQGFVGTGMDVTEQEQLTEDLRRSDYYLAEGQRLAHMGSWGFAPTGFFNYWSRELFHIYGLDPAKEAPSLEEYLAHVHPQDRAFMGSLIKRMLEEASGCDVTKRIVRPNGELRYVRCVGAPVVENGTLKRIVGTAIDVTQHELLTQELRRREAYLAEAQRLSHTGSFGWSVSSGEIFWSDETFRIFQCDPRTKPTVEFVLSRVHPEDRELVQQQIDQASRDGEGFDFEHRLQLPDGSIKHLRVTAHPSRDSLGNLEFVGAVTDVSEQRQAEAVIEERERELQENTAKLEEAQRVAHVGYWEWDLRTDHVTWSDETYRIYGLHPEERPVDLATIRESVHPEDREFVFRKAAEAIQGEVRAHIEHRIVRPSGEVRVVYSQGDLKRDAAGRPWQMFGTAQDITDRKRAEEALRVSETYLAEAQKLTRTGSWVWSVADRSVVHLSEEWYRIYGFNPAEGSPDWERRLERVHPEDRLKWKGTIDRAILEKTDYELDFRIVLPSGIVKWIHTVGHPVLTPAGDLVQFLGSSTDISERKNAERRLQEQEMELRQMLDLTPQHVHVLTADARLVYTNEIALKYHGSVLHDWQLRPLIDWRTDELPITLFHPDDRERVMCDLKSTLSSGSSHETEARLLRNDGKYLWFLFRYNPLRDEQGRVVRWYVAGTDIEDRKQAEERLKHENVVLREEIDTASMFEEIVGTSPPLQAVLSRVSKVARTDSTVLVTGETGTGKELVARAIHRRSRRSSRAFVSVNCAAIPRDLIASELFGHEKGAFTGAAQRRLGRFELAGGGTIFLDEVGELPAETQLALLRVLQEHEFDRVGGIRSIQTDIRVIAATNRDLQAAIAAGSFRSDLFYRLNVFPIEIPPLRDRREDIPMLVEYFVDRFARKAGKSIRGLNKKTLDLLQSYAWPGNIRELQNVIERSVIVCESENFSVDESWLSRQPLAPKPKSPLDLSQKLAAQEKEMIEAALRESGGQVFGASGAAAKLGMARSTLESKIRSLKINKNRFKT